MTEVIYRFHYHRADQVDSTDFRTVVDQVDMMAVVVSCRLHYRKPDQADSTDFRTSIVHRDKKASCNYHDRRSGLVDSICLHMVVDDQQDRHSGKRHSHRLAQAGNNDHRRAILRHDRIGTNNGSKQMLVHSSSTDRVLMEYRELHQL